MSSFSHHESCPECGSKDNVGVWDDGHKYCFGCGWNENENGGSLEFLRQRLDSFNDWRAENYTEEEKEKKSSVFISPDDLTRDFPPAAKGWLTQYGITDQEISRLSIAFNKRSKRIVLPLLDKYGNLLLYQQRRVFDDDPIPVKYLTTGKVDGMVWFPKQLDQYEQQDTVVVVEDILSAIRVGRHLPCLPLMGTNIPPKTLKTLSERFDCLVVWLDPDKKKEAVKLRTSVSALFSNVGAVLSDKDPKEYPDPEIKNLLTRFLKPGTIVCI
jgi:Zn ribbon nucleic-acid-binding protein